jgi:hypothetical protein
MKYIQNIKVSLEGRARDVAIAAKAAEIDVEGAHTSTALFLIEQNIWGLIHDVRFTLPIGQVKVGERIIAAAEGALEEESEFLVLSEDDYEVLLNAVVDPKRHPSEAIMPASLARAILPVLESIIKATSKI